MPLVEPIESAPKTFVRLLVCHDCRSVDKVPDYDGPPEYDHYLEYRVQQHRTNGHPHKGILVKAEDKPDIINATVDEIEEAVRKQQPGAGEGLGEKLYDLRQDFGAEALKCWREHSRTRNCDDYRSDKKRLWLDTKAERKEEGMSLALRDRPNIWLCDHCPVHSLVEQRQRKAKGLYD